MPTVLCPEGAVRLIDGDIEQEGRVEVCLNGLWGLICLYGWDASDAYVACKQLGYDSGIGVLGLFINLINCCNSAPAQLGPQFGSGNGPMMYSNISCQGYEKSLSQCSKQQYLSFTCLNNNYIAEVRCYEGHKFLIKNFEFHFRLQ